MKMKFLLLLFFGCLLTNTAFSQFKIGPKVSAYLSDLGDHQFVLNDKLIIGKGSFKGNYTDLHYSYGIFGRYDFPRTYFQVEILTSAYSSRNSFVPVPGSFVGDDEMFGMGELTFEINRVEIPLSAGVKLGVMRFQAGIIPGFITKGKVGYSTGAINSDNGEPYNTSGTVEDKDQYKKIHFDGQLVVGITIIKRIYLDFEVQHNLSKLRKDMEILGITINSEEKLMSFGLSLAVNVLK
jgi:hypothetical protein